MTEPADQAKTLGGGGSSGLAKASATQGLDVALGGRYLLAERIAGGGMAAVWKAHDQVLDRIVAVKVLHDHLAADEGFRERFRREAISAAKLTHPHVVGLYDTGSDGSQVYLVMEFVDGSTLKEVIAEHGQLDSGRAASVGEKVARALDYAHRRGLVHRDVKPANILIGDDGSVKVADFGIAKADEAEGDLTKTGTVLGTAAYLAPEQVTGEARIDGRADQYGLGCMLYEALTGRQPFKGDSAVATAAQRLDTQPLPLRDACPQLPPGLDAIVMRAMARSPDDRYPSAGHLADALAAFADANTAQTAALTAGAMGAGAMGNGHSHDRTMSLRRPAAHSPTPSPGAGSGGTRVAQGGSAPHSAAASQPAALGTHPAAGDSAPSSAHAAAGGDAPSSAHAAAGGGAAPGAHVAEGGSTLDEAGFAPRSRPRASRRRERAPAAAGTPHTVRWLLPAALFMLLVGTVIGFLLLNGRTVSPAADGGAPESNRDGQAAAQPYEVAAITAFDPQGDGTESDEQLPGLLDGDQASTWQTETYNSADFGGLAKQGVGFVLDLGQSRTVAGVRLRAASVGMNYEVRVAEQPVGLPFDGIQLGSVSGAGARSQVTAAEPVEGRYVLVLITAPLPQQPGGYRATLSKVAVLGLPG